MIEFLLILFGTTMLYASVTSRIEGYIKTLSIQGFILAFIVIADIHSFEHKVNFYSLIFETAVFKAVIIPWFLVTVVRKNALVREVEPHISNFNSLFIVSLIYCFGFFLAYWAKNSSELIKPLFFGISVSALLTGLFLIIARKKLITHIMGFIMLENGIFLLSLSAAKEMPLIINLGVLLDIFICIFLLALFANKIQQLFDNINIDELTQLKD